MDDEQLTTEGHQLIYQMRCILNLLGFPGDDLPVTEWFVLPSVATQWEGSAIPNVKLEAEHWQIWFYSRGFSLCKLEIWHDVKPFRSKDAFGALAIAILRQSYLHPAWSLQRIVPELLPPLVKDRYAADPGIFTKLFHKWELTRG